MAIYISVLDNKTVLILLSVTSQEVLRKESFFSKPVI
jgi:hypothetical protein